MSDLKVQTDALLDNAKRLDAAAGQWEKALEQLYGLGLDKDDFGILGKWAHVPQAYEKVWKEYEDIVKKGAETLHDAAEGLRGVANGIRYEDARKASAIEKAAKSWGGVPWSS